jgi:uncharacterized protein YndB with AHSA1/START domain
MVGKPSLTLVRRIKAPPAKVYAALTKPEDLVFWWGPDAGPVLSAEADVRVGGRFRVSFRMLNGQEHTTYGEYREVVLNERLVFTWQGVSTPERESIVTITLRPISEGTELTLNHEQFPDEAERDSHRDGWNGTLDKLETYVR